MLSNEKLLNFKGGIILGKLIAHSGTIIRHGLRDVTNRNSSEVWGTNCKAILLNILSLTGLLTTPTF